MSPTVPTDFDPEVTFISGVTSDAKVAATSFGTWDYAGDHTPATYDPNYAFYATKWGDTTLSVSGTPGGNVTYWFDAASNWTIVEQDAFVSGLALWSAVADITFSPAAAVASTDFTFIRGTDGSAYQNFPNRFASVVGSGTESGPSTGVLISSTRAQTASVRSAAPSAKKAATLMTPSCTSRGTCWAWVTPVLTTAPWTRAPSSSAFTTPCCGR